MKNLAVKALMLGGLLAALPITSSAQGRGVDAQCSVTTFCQSTRGSTGYNVVLRYTGKPSISRNNFVVHTSNAPVDEFGGFLMSKRRLYRPFSAGTMCLAGTPTRVGPVIRIDRLGVASVRLDARALWLVPGDTRYLQFWYRDSLTRAGVVNFSDALEIKFCQ